MSGASVTDGDFQVETTTGSEADLRASLGMPEVSDTPDPAPVEDEAETDPEPEQAASEPEPEQPKRQPKPRENMQARLSQETRRRHEAEARAAELERTAQELAARLEASSKPAPPQATAKPTSGYPEHLKTWDAFAAVNPDASYEDFTDARTDWKIQQRGDIDQIVQQRLAQIRQQDEEQRILSAHQEREHAAREKYPDYDDAIAAGDKALADAGVQFSPALARAILTFDKSAEMVYWLGTHPTECLQLARDTQSLDVAAAPLIRQLLDARLGAGVRPGAVPAALASSAKPPIKPVGASPVAPSSEYSDDEPFEVHFARENARERKRGRR